jgi:23S rRNA pseudouridine955/2504/2580 synthase
MDDAFRNVIGPDDEGRRLDRILRIACKTVPLSAIHRSLRKGFIRVNGKKMPPDYRCRSGDLIEGRLLSSRAEVSNPMRDGTSSSPSPSPFSELPPELLLLETEELLFLNKPLGILVHDGESSLEAMVRGYLNGKIKESLAFSPGPLHRLDRNTSGIITFSRSISGARDFSEALKNGRVEKTYIALLSGKMPAAAVWRDTMARNRASHKSYVDNLSFGEDPADGIGEAITEVTPILAVETATLAAIRLQTGRTHQIRAQAASHGHPLMGDMKYGGRKSSQPYFLHAWKLAFREKLFKDLPDNITAPIPDYFQEMIESTFAIEANEVYSLLRQFRP